MVRHPPTVGTSTSTAYLDVDANGSDDALTDCLLVLRYLFGITDTGMTTGAISPGAQRTTSPQIIPYLDGIRLRLDADGDGNVDALTDGLLILHYVFGLRGLRGPALVANAVSAGAARTTAEIESYLQSLMP